jgi:hypothetical protein
MKAQQGNSEIPLSFLLLFVGCFGMAFEAYGAENVRKSNPVSEASLHAKI